MFKKIAARIGATLAAAALVGSVYGALPAGTANAKIDGCDVSYPQVRTTTAVSAPYGVSSSVADLITVKVINTSNQDCFNPMVIITPRDGTVFHSIVSTTGGWECTTPGVGNAGPTYCHNDMLSKYSSNTIRVRYDREVPRGPVSGTASSELVFDQCNNTLKEGDSAICVVQ